MQRYFAAGLIGLGLAVIAAFQNPADAQQPSELLIRNGTIVNASGRSEGDVRIRNGTIAEIGRGLKPAPGAREINASGKLVLPGGIDPHVHLGLRPGIQGSDDYTSASRAALAGGITTISNFISHPDKEPLSVTLQKANDEVTAQAIADVILHLRVTDPKRYSPADLALLSKGYTLKIFTSLPNFDPELPAFTQFIEDAGKAGLMTMLHCEDRSVNQLATARLVAKGQKSIKYYPESRPVTSEEVATQRCVAISDITGAPIYIVHVSSARALKVVEAAQARGVPVSAETRILYIHLTRERFDGPDANIYTGYPPLRDKSDKDYLWKGMAAGSINVVATDHIGYTKADKMAPEVDITNPRNAGNYLQVDLPLLYSEGVRSKRITLEQMVALSSTNPAKIFGLYPRKGLIAVGSDADVAIWDPNMEHTITDAEQLSNAKFSIFSGWKVTGMPIMTIRRGAVAYEGGKITAIAGSGQMVPRHRWQAPGGSTPATTTASR
jgi:dihydropyrimidinase